MKILALEPYYGGSHRNFIDGLICHSRHEWTPLTLPSYKWKWRMRHSAITFADRLQEINAPSFDLLFCTDMLNLAEFIALAPKGIAFLPRVIYFHENQLTYPARVEDERDYQFAMTNLTSALSADAVWFNSAFHRAEFLSALEQFLKRMPDCRPLGAVDKIRAKSAIHPPGIDDQIKRPLRRRAGPVRILWNARWEHDKNPEDFFEAVKSLRQQDVRFRLNVVGESFRDVPDVFRTAKEDFKDRIDNWGYQPTREQYFAVLRDSDIVVSTAHHEFFGIAIAEAVAAGCYPLLPHRLAYPEILADVADPGRFFYDGTIKDLTARLTRLINDLPSLPTNASMAAQRFKWATLAPQCDHALAAVAHS